MTDMTVREEIQTAAERDAIITGARETLKHIDTVETIFIAVNTPKALSERIDTAAAEHDIPVKHVDLDNRELGSACMKPYTASVVGVTG